MKIRLPNSAAAIIATLVIASTGALSAYVLKGYAWPVRTVPYYVNAANLDIEVEGGTVGEVTLAVSDLPRVSAGERAVFFVSRDARGRLVPHLRGQSILKLDAQDRVAGSTLSLAALRAEILAAR